jgi:acetolactate synthase-1/3 small subunit
MPEATTHLAVRFHNRIGTVDRIISLLRRRGFPISGITLERTNQPHIGRMTVAIRAENGVAHQVVRHLRRLPDVATIEMLHNSRPVIEREYLLARIRCDPHQQTALQRELEAIGVRVVAHESSRMVLEAVGSPETLDTIVNTLAAYEIEDLARSGTIAMDRFHNHEQVLVERHIPGD